MFAIPAELNLQTMRDIRWQAVTCEGFRTAVLSIFALAATSLAVGVWGVVSFSVAFRNREIGLRMAPGAKLGDVTNLMMREAIIPSFIGLAVGIIAASGLTRFLRSLLYGVATTDTITLVFHSRNRGLHIQLNACATCSADRSSARTAPGLTEH